MKIINILTSALVAGLMFTGCTVKNYASLDTLELKSKNYPNPEEISELSFALARPNFKIKSSLSRNLTTAFKDRLQYDVEHISCHLTDEIHKIILSKGFTITQTFRSYNDMTFTEKRNTSALFYPEIIIEIEEKSMGEYYDTSLNETKGDIVVTAHVNIIMLEPLSGEKIWVKYIPVDDFSAEVKYKPAIYGQSAQRATSQSVPENLKPIIVQIDEFLIKINEDVIEATNKYVEQNEFEFLNVDIKRLKGIKRY